MKVISFHELSLFENTKKATKRQSEKENAQTVSSLTECILLFYCCVLY
jgi:hypothetical protein